MFLVKHVSVWKPMQLFIFHFQNTPNKHIFGSLWLCYGGQRFRIRVSFDCLQTTKKHRKLHHFEICVKLFHQICLGKIFYFMFLLAVLYFCSVTRRPISNILLKAAQNKQQILTVEQMIFVHSRIIWKCCEAWK